jgi:nicotinamide-nucleotide amidase
VTGPADAAGPGSAAAAERAQAEVPEPDAGPAGGDAALAARVEQVHRMLAARQQTVAVAESVTGGLLAAALTSIAGASATFRGGLVVYATDLKARLAGVSESLLAEQGPVAAQVALELARGVRERLSASWGVGVTGVAGPEPQGGKTVGTVFLGVVGPGPGVGIESVSELNLSGDRNMIRVQIVEQAVALLAGAISSVTGAVTPGLE